MELSERIIKYRYKNGISRAKLSRQLKVSVKTLDNWEKGKHFPYEHNLARLEEIIKN